MEAQAGEDDLCQQEQQGEESQAEGCPAPRQPHRPLRSCETELNLSPGGLVGAVGTPDPPPAGKGL